MSVIVKGMKMPAKCCDCDAETYDESFYGDEIYHACSFMYKGYTDEIRNYGRLEECPLRPLPERHGRLIDADALPRYTGYALSADEVATAVENAPTIVEAEGEDG